MKKLCFTLACVLMISSSAMAQTGAQKPNFSMPEKVIEQIQKRTTERYSKMKPEQLKRYKEMMEQRLKNEQNERKKQHIQIELDTLNSLEQK